MCRKLARAKLGFALDCMYCLWLHEKCISLMQSTPDCIVYVYAWYWGDSNTLELPALDQIGSCAAVSSQSELAAVEAEGSSEKQTAAHTSAAEISEAMKADPEETPNTSAFLGLSKEAAIEKASGKLGSRVPLARRGNGRKHRGRRKQTEVVSDLAAGKQKAR